MTDTLYTVNLSRTESGYDIELCFSDEERARIVHRRALDTKGAAEFKDDFGKEVRVNMDNIDCIAFYDFVHFTWGKVEAGIIANRGNLEVQRRLQHDPKLQKPIVPVRGTVLLDAVGRRIA